MKKSPTMVEVCAFDPIFYEFIIQQQLSAVNVRKCKEFITMNFRAIFGIMTLVKNVSEHLESQIHYVLHRS